MNKEDVYSIEQVTTYITGPDNYIKEYSSFSLKDIKRIKIFLINHVLNKEYEKIIDIDSYLIWCGFDENEDKDLYKFILNMTLKRHSISISKYYLYKNEEKEKKELLYET